MAEKENLVEVTSENETDLIKGLLKAADYKKEIVKTIEIKRGGKEALFSFQIRPLSADEVAECRHNATTFMPNPNNSKLPPIAKDVSEADFCASEIYAATVGNHGEKIWDNPQLRAGLQNAGHMVMTSIEIIKTILTSGELVRVSDVIDSISGNDEIFVEYAKN